MSHISANNIDRKLIILSMSMLSGSMNPYMVNILCQLLFSNMDATFYVLLLHYLTAAARNNATCGFFTLQSYLISVQYRQMILHVYICV